MTCWGSIVFPGWIYTEKIFTDWYVLATNVLDAFL